MRTLSPEGRFLHESSAHRGCFECVVAEIREHQRRRAHKSLFLPFSLTAKKLKGKGSGAVDPIPSGFRSEARTRVRVPVAKLREGSSGSRGSAWTPRV